MFQSGGNLKLKPKKTNKISFKRINDEVTKKFSKYYTEKTHY